MTSPENTNNPKLSPEIIDQITDIVRQTPSFYPPDKPVLGETDADVIAPNLVDLLNDPDSTLALAEEGGRVRGFSLAIPIGRMDRTRTAESDETAYIYYTAIEPSLRGQGLVGPLMSDMYELLRQRGYRYVERDAVLTAGYADKVAKNNQGSIVASQDHTKWPEVGPERLFRIDLYAKQSTD